MATSLQAGETRPAQARRRSASLAVKLIVFSVVLTVVAIASVFLALNIELRRQTKQLLAEGLKSQQRLILTLQARSLEQLLRTSALVTQSPTLRAAMETYVSESTARGTSRRDLLATIRNETDRIAAEIGRGLLIVTDGHGSILAATLREGPGPHAGDDLSMHPVVRQALEQDAPVGRQNFSVLDLEGRLYQVGCVPILMQGYIIGTLTLGDRIDRKFVDDLRATFGSDVSVRTNGRTIVSTLAGDLDPLRRSPDEYVSAAMTLGSDGAGHETTLHLFHSLTKALEASRRARLIALLASAAMAAVLAGLAAWMVSRSVLRPLGDFVAFMRSVAGTGNHARRFDGGGAGPEVETLSDAFNHLMERLDEHERGLIRRAQEELERVERLKESEKLAALGRMLSGAAHEINNPLTGVVGNIEMLLAGDSLPPTARQRLEIVRHEGQRIVTLVRNLLRVAHRDKGERTAVDLHQVLRDTVALRQHDFSAAGMQIHLALGRDPIRVQGSELEIEQVVLNLINNAFDALQEGRPARPAVTVAADATGAEAIITVTDNGPGMKSPERVFEHFYTTKPVGKGTGLGLSISQAIVQNHGGRIGARNLPGGGAELRVVLPASSADSTIAERPRPHDAPVQNPQRALAASVLVVDDEPVVLELQMAILASMGAGVTAVGSGAEAIEALRQRDFDLVVSDLKMPGEVTGQALFEWAQKHRPAAARGFLFVTGDTIAEAGFLERAKRPCLLKPFTMEEYVAALKETLHAQRAAA